MSATWAVRFPRDAVAEASQFWNTRGVEVCSTTDSEHVWLRGSEKDATTDAILRGFLSGKRFDVLEGEQLKSPADLVPNGYLPEGRWVPLTDWLELRLPDAIDPTDLRQRLPVRLERTSQERPVTLLISDCRQWLGFAETAPLVRLERLQFAVAKSARVLVRGNPLPALPGTRFSVIDNIAVAAGWRWTPAVSGGTLHRAWKLQPDDIVILQPKLAPEVIKASDWVRATRSSVRHSCAAVTSSNAIDNEGRTDEP